MIQVRSLPRSQVVPLSLHLRAFAARALRSMADQMEPVTAEGVVVRTEPYGYHLDDVIHERKDGTK